MTYPAPENVAGPGIVTSAAGEPAAMFAGLYCPGPAVRGVMQNHQRFSIAGRVGFCVASPGIGSYTSTTNSGLIFERPCARGSVGGMRGNTGQLIFAVSVGGKDGGLKIDHGTATLEARGRLMSANAQVQTRPFLDMPPSKTIDGQMRYDVNGAWLNFAQAAPHFTRVGYVLTFLFDRTCDPDAHYRMTLKGITLDGHALDIPPIDFAPHHETMPMLD